MGIVVFGWIAGTIVNGMVAEEKGRSVGWAIAVSLLCSPLTSYMYLLAVPPIDIAEDESESDVSGRTQENLKAQSAH